MSSQRNLVFENEYVYHIFNRGVEKRDIFLNKRDKNRFVQTLDYYRHSYAPVRYTQLFLVKKEIRESFFDEIRKSPLKVEILAYCLMPNHFHLLIKQKKDGAISDFISKVSNSYTRYFNVKNDRVGPLFQGTFKAVFIETEEQLNHVVRYVHLNPVVSVIVNKKKLKDYAWSSFPDYLGREKGISEIKTVLSRFSKMEDFINFHFDHADYAQQLEKEKHICID